MRVLGVSAAMPLALAACITVNLHFNFPEKELEQKLYEMEQKVREESSQDPVPKGDEKKSFVRFTPDMMLMDASDLQDTPPDVNVKTPAIRKINDQRAARLKQMRENLAAGRAGEGNNARLAERDTAPLDDAARADFRKLLAAENEDREALIKEIARANSLQGDENLDRIRAILARTFKRATPEGWVIQTHSGEWRKKTAADQSKLDKGEDIDK